MRTSFHHQPEAQHPNFQLSASWQADYPIFRRQSGPQSTIVEQLLDAADNFLQTPCKRAADRRLAGEEVRNPTLEPLDRTEGMRPHRIQIEQAAKLVFPE